MFCWSLFWSLTILLLVGVLKDVCKILFIMKGIVWKTHIVSFISGLDPSQSSKDIMLPMMKAVNHIRVMDIDTESWKETRWSI